MPMNRQKWLWTVALIFVLFVAGCTTQLQLLDAPAEEAEVAAEAAQAESQESDAAEEAALLPEQEPPFSTVDFTTDFSKRTVEWSDILSGGPPKDGIQKGI